MPAMSGRLDKWSKLHLGKPHVVFTVKSTFIHPFPFCFSHFRIRNDFKCLCSKIFSATIYRCSRLNKRYWVTRSPKNFLSLSILAFKCECNQRNDCLDNSIVLSRFLIMISLLCISLFDLKIPSHLSVFTPLECAPNFISTHRSKIYISK